MDTCESSALDPAAGAAELVVTCLAGERNAFARIVERYQRLPCSLVYSQLGDLAESEEAAQKTFSAARGDRADLREPGKLRSWLGGIPRHKAGRRWPFTPPPCEGVWGRRRTTPTRAATDATPD